MIRINRECVEQVLSHACGNKPYVYDLSVAVYDLITHNTYGFRLQYAVFKEIATALKVDGEQSLIAYNRAEDITDKMFNFVSEYVEEISTNFVEPRLNEAGRTEPVLKIPDDIREALQRAGIKLD